MYDPDDPRSVLAGEVDRRARSAVPFAGSQYVRFEEVPPSQSGPPTWWVRGANVLVGYTDVGATAGSLPVTSSSDEWMLLLPDEAAAAMVEVGGERRELQGLVVIPPGDVHVEVTGSGAAVAILPAHAAPTIEPGAVNADAYDVPRLDVAPVIRWTPVEGHRLRSYRLAVDPEPGRFGRIWQCSTLMVNYLEPIEGPRDRRKLSPHSHDDFEQLSLALRGEYVHHLRWPWGSDATQWRDDEHERCSAPSVAVIPPRALHTSEAVSDGTNQLLDIFSPPRSDFAEQGWVLNGSEYEPPAATSVDL